MSADLWNVTGDYLKLLAKGQARTESARVKAICCLSDVAKYDQESVQELITILTQEVPQMGSKHGILPRLISGLICASLGFFEAVIKHSTELALQTIIGVYSLLDHGQNWIKVRVLKLLHHLITIEPRLAKKCEQKIYSCLVAANKYSVDCEVLSVAVDHYITNQEMFDLAKGKTQTFLELNDVNLNIIGFRALRKIIRKNPKLLAEYTDKLSQKAKVDNQVLAKEIFGIFEEHLTAEDSDLFMKQVNDLLTDKKSVSYQEVVSQFAVKLALKDPPLLRDWTYFVENLMATLLNHIKTSQDAQSYCKMLLLLSSKPEAKLQMASLYLHILFSFFEKVNPNSDKSKTIQHIQFSVVLLCLDLISQMDAAELEENILGGDNRDSFLVLVGMLARISQEVDCVTEVQMLRSFECLLRKVPAEIQQGSLFLT